VRQMLDVIKDAVESEIRLPNELLLDGESFMIDPLVLTLEPEPEPRPESPIEKACEFTSLIEIMTVKSCHLFFSFN
jgi:hypothetical protein